MLRCSIPKYRRYSSAGGQAITATQRSAWCITSVVLVMVVVVAFLFENVGQSQLQEAQRCCLKLRMAQIKTYTAKHWYSGDFPVHSLGRMDEHQIYYTRQSSRTKIRLDRAAIYRSCTPTHDTCKTCNMAKSATAYKRKMNVTYDFMVEVVVQAVKYPKPARKKGTLVNAERQTAQGIQKVLRTGCQASKWHWQAECCSAYSFISS